MARILIIEDEAPVRANLQDLLTEEGFEVVAAADGLAGLQMAYEANPDLILCDIMLPGLDGRGVLNEIRRNPRTVMTPFIFLTALSTRSSVRHGMNLGADDYLTKPFTRVEVLDLVNSRLTRRAALDRLHTAELQQAEERWLLYDSITYLPSRLTLRDRFANHCGMVTPQRTIIPVLCVSVDRFDRVPAGLGGSYGDQLLKLVADRLVACIGRGTVVTRMRGAMFSLLLPPIEHTYQLDSYAHQINDSFHRPFQLQSQEIFLTVSQGMAIFPRDGRDLDDLLRCAEAARQHAEREGGSAWRLYAPSMSTRSVDQIGLETELYRALERHEFRVFYQPRLDLASDQIVAAEALVRWEHPTRGIVSPLEFIPLAEESALINLIGAWVFAEVCRQLGAWRAEGMPTLNVSLNLSRRQLSQPDLEHQLSELVRRSAIDPQSLELELTESQAMHNLTRAQLVLGDLREMGLRIAIDDFGTGYSSLGSLRTLPLDLLKIDRGFVRDIGADSDAASLVETIIAIAHRLGLRVVAEGVETPEQVEQLRRSGCDEIQGFWLSEPLPATQFELLWRQRLSRRPSGG